MFDDVEKAADAADRSVRRSVRISRRTGSRTWSKLWAYSYSDLADLFQTSEHAVRQAVARGHVVPHDLRSICRYWFTRARATPFVERKPLGAEEFCALRGHGNATAWKRRWPRFDVYRCSDETCREILLEPGYCTLHGGTARPPLILSDDDHFMVQIGRRYIPICHVILGLGLNVEVQHLDGNTWNSHPSNLVVFNNANARERRNRWSYGYRELADLFGLSENGTRQAASRGTLDPASLNSVTSFWLIQQRHKH